MGEQDRDLVSPQSVVGYVAKNWHWSNFYQGCDSNDTAPGLVTDFDRSHPYALACIARRDDEDRDRRAESQRTPDMDRCGRFCEAPQPSPRDARGAFDATDRQS